MSDWSIFYASNHRSVYRTFGISDPLSKGPAVYWTLCLSGCNQFRHTLLLWGLKTISNLKPLLNHPCKINKYIITKRNMNLKDVTLNFLLFIRYTFSWKLCRPTLWGLPRRSLTWEKRSLYGGWSLRRPKALPKKKWWKWTRCYIILLRLQSCSSEQPYMDCLCSSHKCICCVTKLY